MGEDPDFEAWTGELLRILRDMPRSACVLVWRQDGKVLGVARKDDPAAFTLPGGKLEKGETFAQAAARELREETGLDATSLSPVLVALCDGHVCATYEAEVGPEAGPREAPEVRWCSPAELVAGPFGEYNRALFRKLGIQC